MAAQDDKEMKKTRLGTVKHKLYLSLFVINALALIVGFTAWGAFRSSAETLQLITGKMMPVNESVSEVIVLSARLSTLSPRLIFVQNDKELAQLYDELYSIIRNKQLIVRSLREDNLDQMYFLSIITEVENLGIEVERRLYTVKQGMDDLLELDQKQVENSHTLKKAHADFIIGTSPISDDAQFALIIGLEESDHSDAVLTIQAETLALALEIKAEGNLLYGIMETALHYQDAEEITPLAERYVSSLQRLEGNLAQINRQQNSESFSKVSGAVQIMRELGSNEVQNIFSIQKERLRKYADLEKEIEEIEKLNDRVNGSINQLAAHIKEDVRNTKNITDHTLKFGIYTVVGVSSLGIIFSLLLSWFYIGGRVIGRIEKLKSMMISLADKDFNRVIEGKNDRDELGQMARLLATFREKLIENEILNQDLNEAIMESEEARNIAIDANKSKSEFLANMSHELRTPLNSIIGLSQMLSEDMSESEELSMVITVNKSAVLLLNIVNDILDLSKIEAQQVVLESIGFDFPETLSLIADSIYPMASAKGVELNCKYKSEDMPYIKGDPVRLGRVLTNLISNAVKYTLEGHVDVIVDYNRIGDDGDLIEVHCSVIDTGIGIAPEKHAAVFNKFTQADESTTRKFGGTGLGLAITKELVELMGGEIGIESVEGQGSTFWFKIPFTTTDTVHVESRSTIAVDSLGIEHEITRIHACDSKILLAEDHEMNQMFIKKLMTRMSFVDYTLVDNGVSAVEEYRKGDYDLVLMDCHMPEMNGYHATVEIRNMERDMDIHVPIVALTADAMVGTREKCIRTGMDDYVSKPIDVDELRKVLQKWFILPDEEGEICGDRDEREPDIIDQSAEDIIVLDKDAIKDYADTDEEMKGLAELFIEQTRGSFDLLKSHCVNGESAEWCEIAHKMKGGAAMIGAIHLAQLCDEAQAMSDASSESREDKYEDLYNAFSKVIGALQSLMGVD